MKPWGGWCIPLRSEGQMPMADDPMCANRPWPPTAEDSRRSKASQVNESGPASAAIMF